MMSYWRYLRKDWWLWFWIVPAALVRGGNNGLDFFGTVLMLIPVVLFVGLLRWLISGHYGLWKARLQRWERGVAEEWEEEDHLRWRAQQSSLASPSLDRSDGPPVARDEPTEKNQEEESMPTEDQMTETQGQPPVQDTVRAKRFEVVDDAGETRIVLAVAADGSPRLAFYDENGKPRVGLIVLPDGNSGLDFFDQNGKIRAMLGVLPDGSLALDFNDENGKLRAALGLDADGRPGLTLYDQDGNGRAGLILLPDGSPALSLLDENGNPIWEKP